MAKPVVFISSTCEDLDKSRYRSAARDAALGAGFFPEMQEYWAAQDNIPGSRLPPDLFLTKGTSSNRLLISALEMRSGITCAVEQSADSFFFAMLGRVL